MILDTSTRNCLILAYFYMYIYPIMNELYYKYKVVYIHH